MLEATQLHPPRIGPQFPINPGLLEMVRPYAGNIGNNVYPAYVGQTVAGTSPPVLRDRVQVYLWAPNGEVLGLQWYGARLVSSYLGLPLYATWCCGQGTPFTGSSAAGPATIVVSKPSGPIVVPLGGGGGNTPPPVTYTGTITSVPPDTPLVVTLTFTNTVTMVTTTVTTVITGAIPGPFTYTFTNLLPVTIPGTYTVVATVTTFVGQVVFSSSLLITVVAGSPSSSSSSFGKTPGPCCGCTVIPTTYRVDLDPVINGTCTECSKYNTTNVLHNEGVGICVWSTLDTAPCGGSDATWVLSCDGTTWLLQAVGVAGQFLAKYTKSVATWSCLGVNVLAYAGADLPLVCTFPATATVTPI